ncbi:type II secretion system F family protein [Candidatus Bathyarchaeota archaeon]|nr:type II secretion system F family protein [Candidatus Bathyarchaeota archaeon]
MYFDLRARLLIWASSISVALVLYILFYLLGILRPTEIYLIPLEQRVNNSIALTLLAAILPPSIVEFNNIRWLRSVDRNIPLLLRDLAEAVRSGETLVRALEEAAKRDYGPVSMYLERAMVRLSLTSDLEASLRWMGEKLVRPSAMRMATILIEASESGGKIVDILEAAVSLFNQIAEYRDEREAQTRPYLLLAYMGSIVFMVISYVILLQFLAPLSTAAKTPEMMGAPIIQNVLDISYYKAILFWASVMESIFGGLIAGKISGGRLTAGLIHSSILLAVTIAFFNVFTV